MGQLANAPDDAAERYEFSRPHYRLEVQTNGLVLPVLLLRIRRAIHEAANEDDVTDWEDPGPVKLRLVSVPHPPPGHAPVALQLEAAINLAVVWDGRDRRVGRHPEARG